VIAGRTAGPSERGREETGLLLTEHLTDFNHKETVAGNEGGSKRTRERISP